MTIIIFLTIFILTYLAIFFQPFKLKESWYGFGGIVLLLVFGIITFPDIFLALSNFGVVKPYTILIFFFSFAILSVGLDKLGFFEYLSIKAVHLAKHDGLKLFKYLFILSALTSYIAANDIVILTLTPFVLYFAKYSKINPKAYLITMFVVANTASIGQITSNPTNFIVAEAYGIPFLQNLLLMLIPMVLGLSVIYFILKKVFYKDFNIKFKEKKVDWGNIITNKFQCRVFYFILILEMFFFALAPLFKLDLWVIALVGTAIALLISRINLKDLFGRLPWNVILLVTTLFIIISGFIHTGIYDWFVNFLSGVNLSGGYFEFLGLTAIISVLAGLFNNIPVTTLLTSLSISIQSGSDLIMSYAIIIGSNVAANVTVLGSLAGIMWYHLIREKEYKVSLLEFSKYGLLVSVPFVVIVTIVLLVEFVVFGLV